MERIAALYCQLEISEKHALKKSLKTIARKKKNKYLQLLRMLERNPGLDLAQAAKGLYGTPRSKAFLMLKTRLWKRMLDIIIQRSSCRKRLTYREKIPEMLQSVAASCEILSRGMEGLGLETLRDALRETGEYSAMEIRLLVLNNIRRIQISRSDAAAKATWTEMEKAVNTLSSELAALKILDTFKYELGWNAGAGRVAEFLEMHIPVLENAMADCSSPLPRYVYLNLRHQQLMMEGKISECRENIGQMINLMNSHPRLNDESWMGIALTHLASAEIMAANYNEALLASRKARAFFTKDTRNLIVAGLIECRALHHLGNCRLSEAYLDDLRTLAKESSRPHFAFVIAFQSACNQFRLDEFNGAMAQTETALSFNLADPEWNAGIRILQIMILVEKRSYEVASSRIENLRKHISKHGASERFRMIYKILASLERNSFLFKPFLKETEYLEALEIRFIWTAFTCETIRFDEWYRLRREKFAVNIAADPASRYGRR